MQEAIEYLWKIAASVASKAVKAHAFHMSIMRSKFYAQYVKGIPISKWELMTLYDELMERDSDFSFTDYSFGNFIKNDDGIWAVDLNSYSETPMTMRKDLWNRRF